MKHWSQDKNLIDALLKSGIDYETKFNKQGQIALDQRFNQPPQPLSFFKAVYNNVISKGKGFTILAAMDGLPVSGAVFFHFGKKAIYKFGANDLRYRNVRAANMVMWEAIRSLSKNGFDELCLGRTDPANTGLIRFKAGWGGEGEISSLLQIRPEKIGLCARDSGNE